MAIKYTTNVIILLTYWPQKPQVVVLGHSNGVRCINKVTLLGRVSTGTCDRLWVNKPPLSLTDHQGQLCLLCSVGGEMSTVMMLCSWGVKAGMAHSTCGLNVWVAGDTSLTCAIHEHLRDK